ncbi:hypothetical protein CCR94_16045 [Rhodoblastus sphagnicola]|uniref:Uncharacterized protein n=1 Tax=Rhodoblastus sphagnicola TaxID=333368 RepID=A0A2S6N3A5_9HYPH|nr:hypothetical protein [Rhodoblastus sphagnicola]MBB4200846.1 hypothetical protein [Rhodoblastus sphagnicola]PPQ29111.1 hypothetical protein CCR94_16045 [Rhodoblastus sphagnicola]
MRILSFSYKAPALKLASIAAVSVLFAVAPARAYWESFDGGGEVLDYMEQVHSANARGARIEIAGVCASACTMKLGVRNACVYRDAQLWFHAAHGGDGRVNSLGTRILLNHYPSAIRAWVMRHNAVASNDLTTMSGSTAISLGVQDCEHPRSVSGRYALRGHHLGHRHHWRHSFG